MNDALNTGVQAAISTVVLVVHTRKDSIARLTVGYWADRPNQESLVQLTNPIGQHIAFYVHPNERARFIDEMRKLLAAWEVAP